MAKNEKEIINAWRDIVYNLKLNNGDLLDAEISMVATIISEYKDLCIDYRKVCKENKELKKTIEDMELQEELNKEFELGDDI